MKSVDNEGAIPALRPLRPGDPGQLAGYRLVGQLGEGGQGTVYLAEGPDGAPVAVKLLHARKVEDAQARMRFAREVSLARQVGEFCTARVLAADVEGDVPYLVSEYIDGPSLQDAVLRDGPMRGADLDRLAIGMATALAAIHRAGIIHRDFKPSNVLLSSQGPRVVDFGIARALDGTSTLTSQAIGTPAYMAPEQLRTGAVGPAADVFAWACALVFAANGTPPFGNDSVPAVVKRIARDEPLLGSLAGPLTEITAVCLAKDPAARPTAERLLVGLLGGPGMAPAATEATLVAGSRAAAAFHTQPRPQAPPQTPPRAQPEVAGHRPARRRVLTGAGALVAVALTGGAAWAVSTAGEWDGIPAGRTTVPKVGATLWHHALANINVNAMVVSSETLFVQDLMGNHLLALDVSTGNQRWTWNLQTLSVAAAGSTLHVADADNLYGIDAVTGRRKWVYEAGADGLVIAGDGLVAAQTASGGAAMYAVNAADGRKRWAQTVPAADPAKLAATPAVAVIAGQTTVRAVSTVTGATLWNLTLEGPELAAPVAVGDTVYVADGSESLGSGTLWALEAMTGRIRWKTTPGVRPHNSLMAGADTVVVAGTRDDGLRAMDARSGRERWHLPSTYWAYGPVGDTVYADTADGGIQAVDITTGRTRWRHSKESPNQENPVYRTASDKAVFVTIGPRDLYALRAR